MQGQPQGGWNPRMQAGTAHAGGSTGLQPGMAYHPQAGMNPALTQVGHLCILSYLTLSPGSCNILLDNVTEYLLMHMILLRTAWPAKGPI